MADIRLTPAELEAHGTDIQAWGSEIDTLLTQLETKIATICDDWDGLSQDAFLQAYEGMKETLKQFPEVVNGIGAQVIAAAQTFDQADSDLASAFNQ